MIEFLAFGFVWIIGLIMGMKIEGNKYSAKEKSIYIAKKKVFR